MERDVAARVPDSLSPAKRPCDERNSASGDLYAELRKERRATARRILHRQAAAMLIADGLGDGQSQPQTLGIAVGCGVGLSEALKDHLFRSVRYSGPGIDHRDGQLVRRTAGRVN